MTATTPLTAYDPEALASALARIATVPIPLNQKGFIEHGGARAAHIVEAAGSARELSTPLAVIRDDRIEHNIRLFAQWSTAHDLLNAPHVKTTMAPQIIARQLTAGAWALTVATVAQAGVVVELGGRRVIIANELADPADVRQIVRWQNEHPDLELLAYVDSIAGVDWLETHYLAAGGAARLPVLLEVGAVNGRGGVRTVAEAIEVVARARATTVVDVVGCSGFEGILAGNRGADGIAAVRTFSNMLLEVAAATRTEGREWIVSAGGSLFPDVVAEVLSSLERHNFPRQVVVRSGGYVTSDDGYLGVEAPTFLGQRLEDALHVRARVISIPEPGLALLGVGKRDVGTDIHLPRPQSILSAGRWQELPNHVIDAVNDQHAYLRPDEGLDHLDPRLSVGSLVELGVSHPCTTLDRWRYLAIIDAHDDLVDIYSTEF